MIKVITGYNIKDDTNIQSILLKLRSHAMTYPGFVAAENLRSEANSSIIAMEQTWENIEYYRNWESSKIRQSILNEAKILLSEEPKVTVYRVMSTIAWR